MKHLLKWLLLPLLVVVILGLSLKSWLLHSDSGARFIISRVSAQLGDKLSFGEVSGNLDEGLILTRISFHQEALDVTVARAETLGEISLFPVKITISSLHAFDVVVRTMPDETTAPGKEDSLQDILGGLKLPIVLDMQNLQITRLKVIDSKSELLFNLNKADLSANWGDRIELRHLNISSDDLQVSLKGGIDLQPPFSHQFVIDGLINGLHPDDAKSQDAGRFEVQLNGNTDTSAVQIVSHMPTIKIDGQIKRPLDDARFALHVSMEQHILDGTSSQTAVLISDVVGDLEGLPNNYTLQVQASVSVDGYPPARLDLIGEGDLTSLSITGLDVEADFVEARASGKVAWTQPASFDLALDLRRLQPSLWIENWPLENYVHGQVAILSEQSLIRISKLDIKVAGTAVKVAGGGVFDPEANTLDATLNWESIGWPLWQQPYQISSNSGELQLSGTPDDWRFAGDLDLQTPDYSGGSFKLEGQGNKSHAAVNIINGQALGGRVAGDAQLDWRQQLSWNARLDVESLDLTALSSDLQAKLDAKLEISRDGEDGAFDLQFEKIHAVLNGQFKGQSLDGKGGLTYSHEGLNFNELQLLSQNSSLLLQGNPVAPQGLEFSVEVHGPDWVSTFLGGDITGRGRIALAAEQPIIDVELEATQMQWGDWQLERLTIAPLKSGKNAGINLAMDVTNLVGGSAGVQSARFELTGDKDRQTLEMKLNQADYRLQTLLTGAASSWSSLAGFKWSGQIAETQLMLLDESLLSQNNVADVDFSATQIKFQQVCLATIGGGGLCVESDWLVSGQLDFAAILSEVPLSVSSLVFEHGIDFTQTLGGEFSWHQLPGHSPSGRLALNISAGEFGDDLERFGRVKTGQGFLGFDLDKGNLTAGELKVPFPGVGQVDVNYSVSGLVFDGSGKIDGNARINLNDLSVLEGLIPGLESFAGRLNSDLQLSGVVADPQLDGFIELLDASTDIPFIGTQLREVSLKGTVSSNDNAILQGSFKAGDGQGQLKLTSTFNDWQSPTIKLNISGKGLRMLNTPDLRIDADTDMSLGWDTKTWTVGGWVLVQDARITPISVVVSKVTESEDVEIVDGELAYGGQEKEEDTVKLNGDLRITLGDKVRVETDLAKTKLVGEVKLTWQDNLIPLADGNIQASGTVSVFGPRLTLQDGQIRFPKVPVDNPILDIRAGRDIYGNTQIRTAGVSITGTAKRPIIGAYTVPETNSDRAWALLITGNDVDYGRSVGAIEVGTYIAPKLYLSYGISLFNDGNIVSARYDLKKGFGIKASSGQREAGVDMTYTIDR